MNIPDQSLDLGETQFQGWNLYRDVLFFPDFVNAVEYVITFLKDSDQEFQGTTYGDKIRFIFQKEEGISELLKSLRNSKVFSPGGNVSKMITLVLVVEDLKELINNSPLDIQKISLYDLRYLIAPTLNDEGYIGDEVDDEDGNPTESVKRSTYNRFETLLSMGYPVISGEGDIVMFYDINPPDEEEGIYVRSDDRMALRMDKEGFIITSDESDGNPGGGNSAAERARAIWGITE